MKDCSGKILMRESWMEYALNINEPEVMVNFSRAIMLYAVCRIVIDKSKLHGKPRAYFFRIIKPDIDRQLKRMKKGLEPI